MINNEEPHFCNELNPDVEFAEDEVRWMHYDSFECFYSDPEIIEYVYAEDYEDDEDYWDDYVWDYELEYELEKVYEEDCQD